MSSTQFHLAPPQNWLGNSWEDDSHPGWGFLLAMTLLGATLRLYHLAGASLWVDEILTWNMIRPDQDLDLWTQVLDAIQGPLYLLVIWPLTRLQDNEWMMRLPAAISGILTIPMFGLLLGRIMDRRTARLGTLLLAISPFHVWYSQEARGYGFLIFFTVLLILAFLEMIEHGPGKIRALYLALAGCGAMLSNMSGMFMIVALGLSVLIFHRPTRPAGWLWWAMGLGGAMILAGPWILKASGIWAIDRIIPGADTGASLRGTTTFSPLALPYSLYTFFTGHSFGPSLRELHRPDSMSVLRGQSFFIGLAFLPVAVGLLSSFRHLGGRRVFLLFLIAVPVGILVLLALRNIKPWNPRYVAVAFPIVMALLALGLSRLPGRWRPIMALMMVGISFWSLGNHYWNGRYAKADVRRAVATVEQAASGPKTVLVPSVLGVWGYYADDQTDIINTYRYAALQDQEDAQNFFDRELAGIPEFWFASCREWYFDPRGQLPVVLARQGDLLLTHEFPGIKLYRWSRTVPDGQFSPKPQPAMKPHPSHNGGQDERN